MAWKPPGRLTGHPVLTVAQAYALADAVGLRYRALILPAAFTSLRWAELAVLRPEDIDLDACTVQVTRQLYYHEAGHSFGPPKSRASVRVVADVHKHLDWLPASAAPIFASSAGSGSGLGGPRDTAGGSLEGVHLHDLLHTGNQLTANASANLRELMARLGHDSERAALSYLHSTAERQQAGTDAVGDAARAELAGVQAVQGGEAIGTRRARNRHPAAGSGE